MAQILIRGLDDELVERLKERARKNQRSLNAEVREIINEAIEWTDRTSIIAARARIEELRRKFAGRLVDDSTELLREDRDR